MLGEAGATVYCTGRSSRTQPNTSGHHHAGRPETIEETAEMVDAAGGRGIPFRVDHTVEAEVIDLFKRVKREQKRLDVLVNVLTGPPVKSWGPFWKLPLEKGRAMVDSWIWPHIVTCRYAVPLMVAGKVGLIVEIVEQETIGYHGQFFFDLSHASLKRIAYALAEELAPFGASALAITPGFMRTEAILERFGVTEANWREAAENNAEAKRFGFIHSETPCFVGRAVAALAADPEVGRWSGGVYSSWGLSQVYGFTDLDGQRPNIWPAAAAHFAASAKVPHAAVQWQLTHARG
jgi:NAD(P)-dependent dehydrogenase (short-subunit alcohol dehydrogenase family)